MYKKTLYVLSLKYCSNEAEAEDNLHDAFIEIFSNIKNYKGKGSFEGWIKKITINKAITRYKQSYILTAIKDEYLQDDFVTENEINLPLDTLLNYIQELPHQYRLVFSLYELDDFSHQEIADMLSISENTSKSNLHRAKQILKEKIKTKSTFYYSKQKNGK